MSGAHGRYPHLHAQLADEQAESRHLFERLTSLRRTIADAEALLRAARQEEGVLQSQLGEKESRVKRLQKILSPISSLPPETLEHIFRFNQFESLSEDARWGEDHASRRATVLAAVNRKWRDAAVGSPRVWADIYLDFAHLESSAPTRAARIEILHCQLTRAKSAPLAIRMLSYDPTNSDYRYRHAFVMVMSLASQWRKFSLSVARYGRGDSHVIHHFGLKTPLLEEFRLLSLRQATNDEEEGDTLPANLIHKISFLPHAPALRVLAVDSDYVEYLTPMARPSLKCLKAEGLYSTSPDSVIQIIDQSELLEVLELDVLPKELVSASYTAPSSLTFRHLKTLDLGGRSPEILMHFTGILSLPTLDSLTISNYGGTPEELAFLRVCSNIQILDITYDGEVSNEAARIFPLLPRLRKLALSYFMLSVDDILPLLLTDDETGLYRCQKLEAMTFGQCSFGEGAAQLLLDTIKARCEASDVDTRVARFVHVHFFEGICPEWLKIAVRQIVPLNYSKEYLFG